jgi:hypothetical protein
MANFSHFAVIDTLGTLGVGGQRETAVVGSRDMDLVVALMSLPTQCLLISTEVSVDRHRNTTHR